MSAGLLSAALFCVLAAGGVHLAPDQPLPHVYVDDPLILEVTGNVDGPADVSLSIQASHLDEPIVRTLSQVPLRRDSSRWVALKDLPAERGFFELNYTINGANGPIEGIARFARIDRPMVGVGLPLYANNADPQGNTVLALRSVAVRTMRLDASATEIEAQLLALRRKELGAVLFIDPVTTSKPAEKAEALATAFCDVIVRWEVEPHGNTGILGAIVEAVRSGNCSAPVAAVVSGPDDFRALLDDGMGHIVRSSVWRASMPDAAGISEMFADAAEYGYESWTLHALAQTRNAGPGAGVALARRFFELAAAGVASLGIDSALVYDNELQEPLSYLNGLANRFVSAEYAGMLPLGEGIFAPLFRDNAKWFLAAWSEGKTRKVTLEAGATSNLTLTDAMNNAMPLEISPEGQITLELGPSPFYLTGQSGDLPAQAARTQARRLARDFTETREFQAYIPEELLQIIGKTATVGNGRMDRSDFFTLIRAFPDMERRWHNGRLPKSVAVPAMAQMSQLARALAAVEQLEGEAFLEPLSDTLARCEEYQSLYLTSSSGAAQAHERGDWLLGEVRRLMDEAKALGDEDRRIEAAGVGAIAEWRARGLEFAAKAGPLSDTPAPDTLLAQAMLDADEPIIGPTDVFTVVEEEAILAAEDAALRRPELPVEEIIQATPSVHVIQRGESASVIAARYKVRVSELLAANNLTARSTLRIGQELVIPQPDVPSAPATAPDAAPTPDPEPESAPAPERDTAAPTATAKTHTVAAGEFPGAIAQRYGISVADFFTWNNMRANTPLRIGQVVKVSDPEASPPADAAEAEAVPENTALEEESTEAELEAAPPVEARPAEEETPEAPATAQSYTVQRGDNPSVIASKHKISLDDFLRWNNFTRRTTLQVGQEVKVSAPGAGAAASPRPEAPADPPAARDPGQPANTRKVIHTVERGDTIQSIARKYGVDADAWRGWNNIRAGAQLARGKQYVVYVPADAAPAATSSGDAAASGERTHTVRSGDSPYSISQQYKVSLDDLLRWNNLTRRSVLQVGQKLVIRSGN